MAEIRPKRQQRTTREVRPRRDAEEKPTGTLALAIAMSHPLRVRILYAMHSPDRRRSASDIALAVGLDTPRISYHMRELAELGFIEQVDQKPVRGSLEKIFAPTTDLQAWDLEWASMPSAIKRIVAASVLNLAVGGIGAAIDGGTFEARDDSVLGQDSFWTDERGAEEALGILSKALADLITVSEDARARLGETGEEGFLLSYLLSGYEGALRPD